MSDCQISPQYGARSDYPWAMAAPIARAFTHRLRGWLRIEAWPLAARRIAAKVMPDLCRWFWPSSS